MYRKSHGANVLGIACLAVLCLGMSACVTPKSLWSDNDTVKRNSVALHHITHDIAFSGDATALTDAQVAELNRFLVQTTAGYGDSISIDAGTGQAAAGRRDAVSAYLLARGLVVSSEPAVYGGPLAPDTVRLILDRYVVTPPPCPDWRQPSNPDFGNEASGNFGCATATDLGLMVANPKDLVNGKTLGITDAENAAKSVQNYRENKVPEPQSVSTGSSGGSSGGSGGSQ